MKKTLVTFHNGFTLIEIMVSVAIIGTIAAVAIPNFVRARQSAQKTTCIANLKRIEEAKIYWALNGGTGTPAMDDLVPDYIRKKPVCPAGGEYSINDLEEVPTCSLSGDPYNHFLPGSKSEETGSGSSG